VASVQRSEHAYEVMQLWLAHLVYVARPRVCLSRMTHLLRFTEIEPTKRLSDFS